MSQMLNEMTLKVDNKVEALRICYILSPSQSGSTLLSMLLSNRDDLFCGGELDIFDVASEKGNSLHESLCSCGHGLWHNCPFWSKVNNQLKSRFQLTLDQLNLASTDLTVFRHHNECLFECIAIVSNSRLIIDSSKQPDRFKRLEQAGFNTTPIRLQRKPAAVVYSWIARSKAWSKGDRKHNWWDVAEYYNTFYRQADQVLNKRYTSCVRYEALVINPALTISRLYQDLGMEPVKTNLDWHAQDHHHLSGNPMRFEKNTQISQDLRWKKGLSLFQKASINFITFPSRFSNALLYKVWHYPIRLFLRVIISSGLSKPSIKNQ